MAQRAPVLFTLLAVIPFALSAEERSAVMTCSPGVCTPHALYVAGFEPLQRQGYSLADSVPDKEVRASKTFYDQTSVARSDVSKATLTWVLELRAESDGRVLMTLTNDVQGLRKPAYLPTFAVSLAVSAGLDLTKVVLTYDGKTKSLSEWRITPEPAEE
jgi:hypothetical protein